MEEKIHKDIELRSEEVQEILSRPPHALVRWGITVFFVVILLLFIGGCFFSYPDVLEAEVTITTERPPIWIVSRGTGQLQEIYLPDRQEVNTGDVIAILENPAVTADVKTLKTALDSFVAIDSCICRYSLPPNLSLGTMQGAYATFTKCLVAYRDFIELDLYTQKEEATRKELKEYQTYIIHLNKQVELDREGMGLAETTHQREKKLFTRNVTSQADYEQAQQSYLTRRQSTEQLMTSLSSARIQEAQLQQNIIQTQMERTKEANSLLAALKAAYDELQVSIGNWELNYAFVSPAKGILSYNEVWQENQYINAGDKVFSIVAAQPGDIIGKIKLSKAGSGKVKQGQRVNIRMAGYPYMEYGYLMGTVHSVSLLANGDTYTATIRLPQDLQTSYKKQLSFTGELSGTAEIMTDERSLTMRLLDPLRYLWEKHF